MVEARCIPEPDDIGEGRRDKRGRHRTRGPQGVVFACGSTSQGQSARSCAICVWRVPGTAPVEVLAVHVQQCRPSPLMLPPPPHSGMQTTSYVKLAPGVTADQLRSQLASTYEGEPFVRVLPKGVVPHTRHVRGSNYCLMNVFPDRIPGRAIVISVGGWVGGWQQPQHVHAATAAAARPRTHKLSTS